MTEMLSDRSPQRTARAAGALYLVIIACGVFGEVFVRAALVVPGDAAATAGNILESEGLFRLGFAADSLMVLSDVALAVLLYVLLRAVSPTLALMAAAFRLVQSAVIAANLLNHHATLLVLGGTDAPDALQAGQRQALALLFLNLQSHGYDLALIFFGISSLLVGYLVYRAPYLPRALGLLLVAAGLVYLAGSYLRFLAPAHAALFAPAYLVPLVAESGFCLWLLLRGVDRDKWPAAGLAAPAR
jgi:Domain of unknown function (DUF4386)